MDPFSAAVTVVQILDVALRATSALIEYSRNTRNASKDRRMLAEEARALFKYLERLHVRAGNTHTSDQWLEERTELTRQFARAYEDLAAILKIDTDTGHLKQESRTKAIQTIATWSFTKSEVFSVLERISRLQLYANTLLLHEQNALVERIGHRLQDAEAQKQRSIVIAWLTPLQIDYTHETISKRPKEGSRRWFVTSYKFRSWKLGTWKLLWCPGIRMYRQ